MCNNFQLFTFTVNESTRFTDPHYEEISKQLTFGNITEILNEYGLSDYSDYFINGGEIVEM